MIFLAESDFDKANRYLVHSAGWADGSRSRCGMAIVLSGRWGRLAWYPLEVGKKAAESVQFSHVDIVVLLDLRSLSRENGHGNESEFMQQVQSNAESVNG